MGREGRATGLIFAMFVSACGSIPEGVFACSSAAECPAGWSCVEGRCRSSGGTDAGLDSSVADAGDASIDAGESDASFDAGCIPGPEVCNGLDDDCDGVVDDQAGTGPEVACNDVDDDCDGFIDEPETMLGPDGCGCEWFESGGRPYRFCMQATPFDEVRCGTGMRLAVVSSVAEAAAIASIVEPLLTDPFERDGVFIGLRQDEGASTTAAGWRWIDKVGIPIDRARFNDLDPGSLQPTPIENGDEDCGCLGGDAPLSMIDCPCGGNPLVIGFVCEERAEEPCTQGLPCMLAQGCLGQMDCARPPAEQCHPFPVVETCNDWDDDCNGVVDNNSSGVGHACGCTMISDPATTRLYESCIGPMPYSGAACGPRFRLAVIETNAENTFVASIVSGQVWAGLFQPADSPSPDQGWIWHTGELPRIEPWDATQPDDGTGTESTAENCMVTRSQATWVDVPCNTPLGYLCEEL